MCMSYLVQKRPRSLQFVIVLVLLILVLITTACSGDAQIRQRASESEQQFSRLLRHAYQLGLTNAVLQPVLTQEQQILNSNSPFSLFSDQPIDAYYRGRAQRYDRLQTQLQQLITNSTDQEQTLARNELRQTQSSLQRLRAQGLPAQNFASLLTPLQHALTHALTFGDFATMTARTSQIQQSLSLLESTSGRLNTMKSIISLLQESNLAATPLQTEYNSDQHRFARVGSATALQQVRTIIDGNYQQAMVMIVQAEPSITNNRLNVLDKMVQQMSSYHIDAAPYQQRLNADKGLVHPQMNFQDFQHFVAQVDADILKTHFHLLSGETHQVLQQFHQDVNSWSPSHMYQDPYDGLSYAIDTSYLPDNFGNDADTLLSQAKTIQDVQQALKRAQDLRFNHQLLEQDYNDSTPYDQVHQADLEALSHYQLQKGQVIVISLAEQALRLYQDGKLVRSFLVTTGRAELPSPAGLWSVQNRLSPTRFHSDDPPDSPYWYPDTHINYAILFHDGGYFIHDSWWRYNYGPGTQFPHVDASGDQRSSGNGSHGCVNLPLDEATWLYNNTDWNTSIVVY